jgi:hypothetical protein
MVVSDMKHKEELAQANRVKEYRVPPLVSWLQNSK